MTIKYYVDNKYGRELIIVSEPKQQKALQLISGQKTLTSSAIQGLKELGFSFKNSINPNYHYIK